MDLKDLATVTALVTGVTGTVMGVLNYIRSRANAELFIKDSQAARKADRANDFLKEYFGPEFMLVRSVAWNIEDEYCSKNPKAYEEVAKYLVDDRSFNRNSELLPPGTRGPNHQTPLQNLSRLLNFWHRLGVFSREGLVNSDVLSPLRHEYSVWLPVFDRISVACRTQLSAIGAARSQTPAWLADLDSIGKFVW